MHHERQAWMGGVIACGVAALLLVAGRSSAAGLVPHDGWGVSSAVYAGDSLPADPLSRLAHRMVKRGENTTMRMQTLLSTVGAMWLSILASALVFLLVAAVSSAADFRMLALRHRGLRVLWRHLGYGTLTFLRILRDPRTPGAARLVLFGALLYWLLPMDLIPDNTVVPGFVDDVLVAVVAAKSFVYVCPDSLVARHAAAVEAHA